MTQMLSNVVTGSLLALVYNSGPASTLVATGNVVEKNSENPHLRTVAKVMQVVNLAIVALASVFVLAWNSGFPGSDLLISGTFFTVLSTPIGFALFEHYKPGKSKAAQETFYKVVKAVNFVAGTAGLIVAISLGAPLLILANSLMLASIFYNNKKIKILVNKIG